MEIICKNCQQHYTGNYCNNCGQPAETHKINAHYLWHDIQHSILHFDAGIPYSIKQLFTRPGHSIREFIEGKRIKHFKPLSLVTVLAAFYGFLYHYYHLNLFKANEADLNLNDFNEWNATHFAWTTIALYLFILLELILLLENKAIIFLNFLFSIHSKHHKGFLLKF